MRLTFIQIGGCLFPKFTFFPRMRCFSVSTFVVRQRHWCLLGDRICRCAERKTCLKAAGEGDGALVQHKQPAGRAVRVSAQLQSIEVHSLLLPGRETFSADGALFGPRSRDAGANKLPLQLSQELLCLHGEGPEKDGAFQSLPYISRNVESKAQAFCFFNLRWIG